MEDEGPLTEEKATEIINTAARDLGLDPSGWEITFDCEGTAEVARNDRTSAHIRVHALTEEGKQQHPLLRNGKLFGFVAYHEVGHVVGQHDQQHDRLKARLRFLFPVFSGLSLLAYGICKALEYQGIDSWLTRVPKLVESWYWLAPLIFCAEGLGSLGLGYLLVRLQSSALEQEANMIALDEMVDRGHMESICAIVGVYHALARTGVYRAATSHPPLKEELAGMLHFLQKKKGVAITVEDSDNKVEVKIDNKRVVTFTIG